jgi:hypothetical protein
MKRQLPSLGRGTQMRSIAVRAWRSACSRQIGATEQPSATSRVEIASRASFSTWCPDCCSAALMVDVTMSRGRLQRAGAGRAEPGMDQLREMLATIEARGFARGNFLGLLHILIGRRIISGDGQLVSAGLSWREVAALLKRVRWDRTAVTELGLDLTALPPRDRERFWYAAIVRAAVDSASAVAAGDRLADDLRDSVYRVSPAPAGK